MDASDPHPLDTAAKVVGGRRVLAEKLDVTVGAIGNWKVRGVPFEHCTPIERLTGGVVTRRELRPSDWIEHWPELANSAMHPQTEGMQ